MARAVKKKRKKSKTHVINGQKKSVFSIKINRFDVILQLISVEKMRKKLKKRKKLKTH